MPTADEIRALLARGAVEDAFEAFDASRDTLDASELEALEGDVWESVQRRTSWDDPKRGSRALKGALDFRLRTDAIDGDTITYLLVMALLLDPDDDDTLVEYLRGVADNGYRYTDRSLLDVAEKAAHRDRARWLALLDVAAEYMVVEPYLTPPNPIYVGGVERAVAAARALGGDDAGFREARAWLLAKVPFARVPEDVFAKYSAKG